MKLTPGHSCAMIRTDSSSRQFSIIVVGGRDEYSKLLGTVEVLHEGGGEWQVGPDLPFGIANATLVEDPAGVNFINILRAAFTHVDPESAKKLLGSTHVKAARKHVGEIEPRRSYSCGWTI